MLSYILQVSICLCVFYLLYIAFFSRETFFATNRYYLLGTLLLSLVLPLIPAYTIASAQPELITTTLEPVVVGIQDVRTALERTPETLSWKTVLISIYWLVASILFLRMVHGLGKISGIIRNPARMERKGSRTIIFSTEVKLPFSFFSWIFFPVDHQLSEEEFEEVFAHESAHASALHSMDVLVMELACILFWPSPFIYFYRKSLRRVHEYMADAAVLQKTPLKKYGHLLLSRSVPGMQAALANHFFQSQLKQRIMMMTKNKSRRRSLLKYMTFLPVLLIAVSLVAFRDIAPTPQVNEKHEITFHQDSVPIKGEVYRVVEQMPLYPGCKESGLSGTALKNCSDKKLIEYIYQSVTYPKAAMEKGVEGNLVVSFLITAEGKVINPKIIQSPGYGTDETVLAVISKMPDWTPGYQGGKAVNVEYIIPVQFKLGDDDSGKEKGGTDNKTNPNSSDEDGVFVVVDEMPRFPGCEDEGLESFQLQKCSNQKLIEFMGSKLKYPAAALDAGIEGKTIASFIVRKDGSISDAKILRSIGHGTDEAVLGLVKEMPQWIPGKHKGELVDVKFTIPVAFALPKEETSVQAREKPSTPGSSDAGTFEVYPVPGNDMLNIRTVLSEGKGELLLELLTTDGKMAKRETLQVAIVNKGDFSTKLDTEDLAPGSYVLRMTWNGSVTTKSVILQ